MSIVGNNLTMCGWDNSQHGRNKVMVKFHACELSVILCLAFANGSNFELSWATFPAQSGLYGMTYFKRPVGRATDGRLTVDFLAEALGLPCISPYLKSIGPDYKHGANYATLASTVLLPNASSLVTGIQVEEFHHSSDQQELIRLPSLDVIGKSLYTLYIGQNDFTSNLGAIGVGGVKQYLPQVVLQIACTIKELYGLGGRPFLVLNLAPIDGLNTKVINGSPVTATACSDPYNYVSWDGVHATEAANKLTSWAILNGSLFSLSAVLGPPPYSLSKSFFFQRFDWIMKALATSELES
ncbi:unnamed protein product [Malus baccata var. baccata]